MYQAVAYLLYSSVYLADLGGLPWVFLPPDHEVYVLCLGTDN